MCGESDNLGRVFCKAFVAAKHLFLQIVTHEINDG